MKKIKKLVVGNWKMNPVCMREAKKIAGDIKKGIKNIKKTQVVICPSYTYLTLLSNIRSTSVFLGSQNAFYETFGPYTGEVSFSQLHQFKVSHVILGHSERRAMGETDEIINKKVKAVVGEGMTAILCVGEKVRDHHGDYFSFVKQQIVSGVKDVPKKLIDHVVIAYEPVWAIGAKEAMNPRDIHEMSIYVKKVLHDIYGSASDGVRILYGGSVSRENTGEIMRGHFVHGLLVGRESLNAKNFVDIVKIVEAI